MYRRNVILSFRDRFIATRLSRMVENDHTPQAITANEIQYMCVCICLSDKYWSKSLNKNKFDSSVGSRSSLYSEVNNEVRFESYLDLITNVNTRVAVTKMRISCHLLPIESGRYKKIPRVERLCSLCNRSEIGDEFHWISLSHMRGIFLENLYSINSNFTNMSCKALFLYIMSMCDENIINLSAPF